MNLTHYNAGVIIVNPNQNETGFFLPSPLHPFLFYTINFQEPPMEEFQSFFKIYLLKDRTCFLSETMLFPRPIQNCIRAILDVKYYGMFMCNYVPVENSNLKHQVKVPLVMK